MRAVYAIETYELEKLLSIEHTKALIFIHDETDGKPSLSILPENSKKVLMLRSALKISGKE